MGSDPNIFEIANTNAVPATRISLYVDQTNFNISEYWIPVYFAYEYDGV